MLDFNPPLTFSILQTDRVEEFSQSQTFFCFFFSISKAHEELSRKLGHHNNYSLIRFSSSYRVKWKVKKQKASQMTLFSVFCEIIYFFISFNGQPMINTVIRPPGIKGRNTNNLEVCHKPIIRQITEFTFLYPFFFF